MMKASTNLFPEKKEYDKIDDAAIGWQHRKRKTNPRLEDSAAMRFSYGQGTDS